MSMIDAIPLLVATGADGGYQISRSVRTRSSASGYFNKTLTTPTNNKIWTWSAWVKRGTLSTQNFLFNADNGSANSSAIDFLNDKLRIYFVGGTYQLATTQVFRDPSAWYHLIFAIDTTQATASNRVKVYVNGIEVTAFSTTSYPTQNLNSAINSAVIHTLAFNGVSTYFDGYMAEVNFIDGQALTPSSFGETNAITGVWQPKRYAGTYGTNGFYLNFSDNSNNTATTIGKDNSGNSNNWTPNNVSVTAGVTYDSMIDVPTLYADGTEYGRGNYCTWNPVNVSGGGTTTITNGNLATSVGSTTTFGKVIGTIGMSTGKWYWETTITAVGSLAVVGIGDGSPPSASFSLGGFAGEISYSSTGNKYTNAVSTAYGATYTTNDIIGVAYDADAGSITFYKNNSSQGAITGFSGTKYAAVSSGGGTNPQYAVNFGQRPFAYTPPTGFVALNTQNLPDAPIKKGNQYFDATTYSGQNTSLSITNSGSMQPDLVWIKKRNGATDHNLTDVIRGTNRNLISNSTAVEDTVARLTSFDSGGFTLAGNFDNTNISGSTYVAWQWDAGDTTVTNTSGSISAQVRANPTAGFSVVTYTGTGANATVGHGLGVAPKMIIVKRRNGAIANWRVYHANLTSPVFNLYLSLPNAQTSDATMWNSTAPTSSVFSIGTSIDVNTTSDYVAYCFAAVAGYSAFGSYTGNSSADGSFVYLGFKPRWIMIKNITIGTAGQSDWVIYDTTRGTSNVVPMYLLANLANAEATSGGNEYIDILSNGFKLRGGSNYINSSSYTYIYAAFAENPFKHSLAR